MGILQIVQPMQGQLITTHAVNYDNPDGENRNSVRAQSQAVLQLTAHGHPTLELALAAYFGDERRAGDDVARPHTIRTRALHFPPVLSIGMLRQDENDRIDMPEVFRVPATIMSNGLPGPRYRLQAFIVRNTFSHKGGGHYVAVMRDGQGWAESDDMGKGKKGEEDVMTPRTRDVDVSTHALGDHPAPAYSLATLYTYVLDDDQSPHAPNRVSFPSSDRLGDDAITRYIYQSTLREQVDERRKIVGKFLEQGGTQWEAIDLLRRFRDNTVLGANCELTLRENRGQDSKGQRKDVSSNIYYAGYKDFATSDLLALANKLPGQIERGQESGPTQLEAVTELLRERQQALRGDSDSYHRFFEGTNESGTHLVILGTAKLRDLQNKGKVLTWIDGVSAALLGASFIASRRPALEIRIRLRPEVTEEIASTYSVGNRITINLDDYQVTDFTVGQTIGLLAHEIGVHSLDSSTLSSKELEEEAKDKNKAQTGQHGSNRFTIVADSELKKQQDDHLTIGRGILGQLSALPRLNMYESTMVSLLEALPEGDPRWEAAAAYCIDIARILVNNDDPTAMTQSMQSGLRGKLSAGWSIASTAVNEWTRIRAKYPKHKAVQSVTINTAQMLGALVRLSKLLDKVRKEGRKKCGF